MLKKIITGILIIVCLSGIIMVKRHYKKIRNMIFPSEKNISESPEEKKMKVNLSTKKGTVRTFTQAVINNEPEIMWICFSDDTKKILEDSAKYSGKDMNEFKQEICNDLRKSYLEKFYEVEEDMDELVNAVGRDIGKSWVTKDNKNYIDFQNTFRK